MTLLLPLKNFLYKAILFSSTTTTTLKKSNKNKVWIELKKLWKRVWKNLNIKTKLELERVELEHKKAVELKRFSDKFKNTIEFSKNFSEEQKKLKDRNNVTILAGLVAFFALKCLM